MKDNMEICVWLYMVEMSYLRYGENVSRIHKVNTIKTEDNGSKKKSLQDLRKGSFTGMDMFLYGRV